MSKKSKLLNILYVLIGATLNSLLFLFAYKKLALPFLPEEQRVENAPIIFYQIVPGFIIISVVMLIIRDKLRK